MFDSLTKKMKKMKKVASKKMNLSSARVQTFYSDDWQLNDSSKRLTLTTAKYGCPKQTFVRNDREGSNANWYGPNRRLVPRGDRFYCCTNNWCSARRGGWFTHFHKNSSFLKYH